jgi:hypothetical protein
VAPGAVIEPLVLCEDAERFIEEVRGDEPELAKDVRIEERNSMGGVNEPQYPRGRVLVFCSLNLRRR